MRRLQLLLFLPFVASADYYTISTVAGIGHLSFNSGQALSARLIQPVYVAADSVGNIYVSDGYYKQVFQIASSGSISVYAGTGTPGFSGDGGNATAAQLSSPLGLAVDSTNNLYIADGNRVRRVTPAGIISTIAGNGQAGVVGDGGSATSAAVGGADGVAVDGAGNLYISQINANVIRKVTPAGIISTLAGTGKPGFSGDGGAATAAMLFSPQGMAADAAGNLYVADTSNNRVRKISLQGIISTFAGNGMLTPVGDGGPATSATLVTPWDVALDSSGNVYIADSNHDLVRMVGPDGMISTLAGGGNSLADGPLRQALLLNPIGLAVDNKGAIIVVEINARQVRRITPLGITTIAGLLPTNSLGDNIPANTAPLLGPFGVALDVAQNLYLTDHIDHRVRKVTASTGSITTVAGNGLPSFTGDGGPAANAAVGDPRGMGFDPAGDLYIATGGAHIRKIAENGVISTIAGTTLGYSGDGGAATSAQLGEVRDAIADGAGNVFIVDVTNQRIRRVNSSGIITTYAGTGVPGFSGDNGPATAAQLYSPFQLALDSNGNLYISDTSNYRIRKVTPGGIITTVAGIGVQGFSGDGGPATSAQLGGPSGVTIDAGGNLYLADGGRIRRVDAATGTISTIAGTGVIAYNGDDILATSANLSTLNLTIDNSGEIYFTDPNNERVRKLTPVQLAVKSISGDGQTGAVGAAVPNPVVVLVTDSLGNPIAGATVNFTGANATVNPASAQTDAMGHASAQVTLGATPGPATVTASVTGLPPVAFNFTVTTPPPLFSSASIDNGASFVPGSIVPGEIATIFGANLTTAPGINLASSLPLPTQFLNVSVLVNGVAAPIFAVDNVNGQQQINFQVPWELASQSSATLQVVNSGVMSAPVAVPVVAVQPGVFFYTVGGNNFGAIIHTNGQTADTGHPAAAGEIVQIYCSGLGAVSPQPQTGAAAPGAAATTVKATVTIGGAAATVDYSGLAPTFVGLYQMNAHVPLGLRSGNQAVVITIGGASSRPVLLPLK